MFKARGSIVAVKVWLDRNSSGLPTGSCSTNPVRQLCLLILVQPVPCVLMLVYQHRQVLRDVQGILRRTVTSDFNIPLKSQIRVDGFRGQSNLTSFHHCVELSFSVTHRCQTLMCGSRLHCMNPHLRHNPAVFIIETGPSIPRCGNGVHWRRYSVARFIATNSNSRGSLILRAKRFAVSARSSNRSWGIMLHLPSAEMESFFRPKPTCRVTSLVACSMNVFVFALHPDSLMMRVRVSCQVQCPRTVQFDLSRL